MPAYMGQTGAELVLKDVRSVLGDLTYYGYFFTVQCAINMKAENDTYDVFVIAYPWDFFRS